MDSTQLLNTLKTDMKKAVQRTLDEFSTIHTGKASPSMIENIIAEAYGSKMPLKELATITTPEARTLSVQPWDKSTLTNIENALRKANVGFNPIASDTTLLCPLPDLSKERRKELVKMCNQFAEQGRVGVRAARQHSNQNLKQMEKDKTLSEDEAKRLEKTIQEQTNHFINTIEQHLKHKEKELLQC